MVGSPHNSKRRQLEAIELMSPPRNVSCRKAAIYLKVPRSTLNRWFHHFNLFGEVPAVTANRNRLNGCLRRKYRRLVTPAAMNSLRILVRDSPQLYLDEFRDAVFAQTGVLLTCSTTIYRLLIKLGWSLKKMFADAAERS